MLFSPAIASSMGLGDLRLDRVGIGTRVGGDYRHLGDAEARDDGNPEREERVDAVARQRDSQCDDGERIADRVTSNGVHGSVPLAFTDYGSHPTSGQRLCRRNDRNPVSDGGGPWQDDGVACLNTAGDLNHRRVGQTDLDNLQLGAIVDVGIDVLLAVALLECRGRHDDGIVNPRRLDHHGRRHARAELASWIRRHDVHAGGAGPGVDAGIDGLHLCFKGLIGECRDVELHRLTRSNLAELALFDVDEHFQIGWDDGHERRRRANDASGCHLEIADGAVDRGYHTRVVQAQLRGCERALRLGHRGLSAACVLLGARILRLLDGRLGRGHRVLLLLQVGGSVWLLCFRQALPRRFDGRALSVDVVLAAGLLGEGQGLDGLVHTGLGLLDVLFGWALAGNIQLDLIAVELLPCGGHRRRRGFDLRVECSVLGGSQVGLCHVQVAGRLDERTLGRLSRCQKLLPCSLNATTGQLVELGFGALDTGLGLLDGALQGRLGGRRTAALELIELPLGSVYGRVGRAYSCRGAGLGGITRRTVLAAATNRRGARAADPLLERRLAGLGRRQRTLSRLEGRLGAGNGAWVGL